jgi:7-carboxy-7-deazaguanine synthase
MNPHTIKYSEIFYSLQGEGALIGVPSVFFRTSFCNLRCHWCDTPYTSWQPESQIITVMDAVKAITDYGVHHVVITGGEPFLQKEPLTILCDELMARGHHVTIETNATLFAPVKAHLISMSPKLAHSTPLGDPIWATRHEQSRLQLAVIQQFLTHYDCQLKFVLDTAEDILEIKQLLTHLSIKPEQVILMPQGRQIKTIADKQQWLAELCKQYGFRYSPRLHIDLWEDQRGT